MIIHKLGKEDVSAACRVSDPGYVKETPCQQMGCKRSTRAGAATSSSGTRDTGQRSTTSSNVQEHGRRRSREKSLPPPQGCASGCVLAVRKRHCDSRRPCAPRENGAHVICRNLQGWMDGRVISSHTPFTCLPYLLPKPNQSQLNRLQPSPFRSNPMYLLTDLLSAYNAFPACL